MKKKLRILLISSLFLVILIGCIVKFYRAEDRPKVVVVLKDFNSEYWEITKAGVEKGFRDFEVDGKVIAPKDGTVESQREMLENVLKEKPDVLIVSPTSPDRITPVLEKFVKMNIPVLLLDTYDSWEGKTAYIGTDNLNLGRIAGELLASHLQPGDEAALIGGDIPVIGKRIEGAKMSLEAAGIKIAAEKVGLSDHAEITRKATETILRDDPDVKGIITTNDIVAVDALKVIKDHGLKIPVIGADGIIKMIKLIEDGTLTDTVAQNPYDMGYLSIETALKVIKGEDVKKNIDTGVDVISQDNAKLKLDFLKGLMK
ncbi:substrate-binding domain-containing protein [Ectobacillus funiculus]|uniref:sugar ABC transporter substrate-binding protein n=1 Tax=Ectobacillus funiculus TaxID=137993 RepID=UPI003978B076